MNGVGAPWLLFTVAATVRWERAHPSSMPRPGVYVGGAVVFSALALIAGSERARPVASALAWALVIAEALNGDLIPGAATGNVTGTTKAPAPFLGGGGGTF